MYCIYCGRICDFHPSRLCIECRERIEKNNERVYLMSLLVEAIQFITDIQLLEKIEKVVSLPQVEVEKNP